jgi:hypothetical protein
MADDEIGARHAYLAAVHRAARLERAHTLRRLLQSALRGRGTVGMRAPADRRKASGRRTTFNAHPEPTS